MVNYFLIFYVCDTAYLLKSWIIGVHSCRDWAIFYVLGEKPISPQTWTISSHVQTIWYRFGTYSWLWEKKKRTTSRTIQTKYPQLRMASFFFPVTQTMAGFQNAGSDIQCVQVWEDTLYFTKLGKQMETHSQYMHKSLHPSPFSLKFCLVILNFQRKNSRKNIS